MIFLFNDLPTRILFPVLQLQNLTFRYGKVTNTFKTIDYDDRYNTFITKAIAEGREKRTWDIAITGQIGGKNENGIGYPEDRNANLRNVSMDVDWVRVFTRDETEPEIPEKPEYPVEKFDYSRAVVEKRVFDSKMYWYPIPESEILCFAV